MPNLDPLVLRLQIEQLLREFPELLEDEILRADTIEGETDLHKFLSAKEHDRQEALTMVKAIDLTLDERTARRDRYRRREKGLRRLIFNLLGIAQLRKVELPESTLSVKAGPSSIIITDESAIPDSLCRIIREPDKKAIRAEIEAGGHVPGATLSNAEPILSIRTR